MSPLATILMRLLRNGLLASAAMIVLFLAIELGKNWGGTQDKGFLGLLAAMLAGALWMARSITKELGKDKKDSE